MRNTTIVLAGTLLIAALSAGGAIAAEVSQVLPPGGTCQASTAEAPRPIWRTPNGCNLMSHCPDDDYCWELCPTALSAACVNSVCQYTQPTGPGGPSGGGGCPLQSRCVDDYDCVFFGGVTGTCVNGICVC